MTTKIFNIAVPQELLEIINQQAKVNFTSRNEYVKGAILTRLKAEKALEDPTKKQPSYNEVRKRHLKETFEGLRVDETWDDIH